MIKFENTEILGWEHALRGMRNPLNSWDKNDSEFVKDKSCGKCVNENKEIEVPYWWISDVRYVGPNDQNLMKRLRNAGTDHRKFMRMITVYTDITAPLYWWKEFDTYKVGTVANSCSTMHTIHKKEFTMDDFSCEHLSTRETDSPRGDGAVKHNHVAYKALEHVIYHMNNARNMYLKTKDKKYWWQMIQLLPTSYNQKRTVMLNYEVLANMYKSRKYHKLDEWRELCKWIESLPYSELITGTKETTDE